MTIGLGYASLALYLPFLALVLYLGSPVPLWYLNRSTGRLGGLKGVFWIGVGFCWCGSGLCRECVILYSVLLFLVTLV